jgi:hypothetical protein
MRLQSDAAFVFDAVNCFNSIRKGSIPPIFAPANEQLQKQEREGTLCWAFNCRLGQTRQEKDGQADGQRFCFLRDQLFLIAEMHVDREESFESSARQQVINDYP